MNRVQKQLLCMTVLLSTVQFCGASTTTNIVPRSQSFNAARQMIGWNNPEWGINRYPQEDYYASFNVVFEYTRTFRDDRLARALFGNDLTCSNALCASCKPCGSSQGINISGSAIDPEQRGATDWLAEYFGLPRDFQSTVFFKPTISNYILDFSFYAGLDAWVDGLYFRIHGPFVHTAWNLNASEAIAQNGTTGYFQGYFSSDVVPTTNLTSSFLAYANGCTPLINNNFTSGQEASCQSNGDCDLLGTITWNSLCCSRISNDCSASTRNGFGELRFVLGYNFLNDADEQYHAGLGVYIAAPTGTRVGDQDCNGKGRYLFEPIVGNGKHWELGAQVTAHHIFWNNTDNTKSLGVYVEANATHLFAASQTRCFDLLSAGSSSRYMLAERLTGIRNNLPEQNLITPTQDPYAVIFANEYAPVANLTSRNVKTSIAVQGDIAVTLAYQTGNFQWDIGYNFWGRTCENICIDECCPTDIGTWALKGDNRVYGFTEQLDGSEGYASRIYPTDSKANIHAGSNLNNGVDYTGTNPTAPINEFADNAVKLDINILPNENIFISASEKPLFITESDFDLNGTRGSSNKVFTNFNWKFDEYKDTQFEPYVSLGAEIEFGSGNNGCCNQACESQCCSPCSTTKTPSCSTLVTNNTNNNDCVNCALSQWGIWLKIGASYN